MRRETAGTGRARMAPAAAAPAASGAGTSAAPAPATTSGMMASLWAVTTATSGWAPTAAKPSSSRRRVEVPAGVATKGTRVRSVRATGGGRSARPSRPRLTTPAATWGEQEGERLLADVMTGEVLGEAGGLGDAHLGAPVADHGQEVARVLGCRQVDDHARVQLPVPTDQSSQGIGSQGGEARHGERSRLEPGHGGDGGASRLEVAQDEASRTDECPTGRRQVDPPADAVEEGGTELCLEVAHGDREGRLAGAGGVGRGGETALVDHGHEVGELSRIHMKYKCYQ